MKAERWFAAREHLHAHPHWRELSALQVRILELLLDHADNVSLQAYPLERGLITRDFALIRRANEQLERLGVTLSLGGTTYGRAPEPTPDRESPR